MSKFEMSNQLALVTKVDPKRGKTADAYVSVRISLALIDMTSATAAGALYGESEHVREMFFQPLANDPEERRSLLNLATMSLRQGFKNAHEVSFRGQKKMRAASIASITLEPKSAGKFDGTLVVVFDHPPTGFIEWVSEMLNRTVHVTMRQDDELPFVDPDAEPPVTTTVSDENGELPPKPIEPGSDSLTGKARKTTSKPAKKAPKPGAKKRPARKGKSIKKAASES